MYHFVYREAYIQYLNCLEAFLTVPRGVVVGNRGSKPNTALSPLPPSSLKFVSISFITFITPDVFAPHWEVGSSCNCFAHCFSCSGELEVPQSLLKCLNYPFILL